MKKGALEGGGHFYAPCRTLWTCLSVCRRRTTLFLFLTILRILSVSLSFSVSLLLSHYSCVSPSNYILQTVCPCFRNGSSHSNGHPSSASWKMPRVFCESDEALINRKLPKASRQHTFNIFHTYWVLNILVIVSNFHAKHGTIFGHKILATRYVEHGRLT